MMTRNRFSGLMIVKSILRTQFDVNRIVYRDAQSYFSVLLDDNNRKPICRLYLDGVKKGIVLFDSNKKESKHEIKEIDDIYNFSDQLLDTVIEYENKKATV